MPAKDPFLVFSGPDYAEMKFGRDKSFFPNATKAQISEILESGKNLWGENSGATIQWCYAENYHGQAIYSPIAGKPSLAFLYNDNFGFHVRLDHDSTRQIAIIKSQHIVRVTQQICGELAFFPSNTFLGCEIAKSIVTAFVEDNLPFNGVKWKDAAKFDYSDENAWQEFGIVD